MATILAEYEKFSLTLTDHDNYFLSMRVKADQEFKEKLRKFPMVKDVLYDEHIFIIFEGVEDLDTSKLIKHLLELTDELAERNIETNTYRPGTQSGGSGDSKTDNSDGYDLATEPWPTRVSNADFVESFGAPLRAGLLGPGNLIESSNRRPLTPYDRGFVPKQPWYTRIPLVGRLFNR